MSCRFQSEVKEVDEKFISQIILKLHRGIQLDEYEINLINVALRKENNIKREPYYEVVYHDEYDHTEHRVMNPVRRGCADHGDYMVQYDRFEVDFNRYIPKRCGGESILFEPKVEREKKFLEFFEYMSELSDKNNLALMIQSYIQKYGPFTNEVGEKVRMILEEKSEVQQDAD